ncbi:MAG: sigma-70 family RNA polymerase sigma factor [Puniceicoccales bacterium]|nr:sigma-70 family RNA polymerase sigma factor [Puniceicoccales bacterium]
MGQYFFRPLPTLILLAECGQSRQNGLVAEGLSSAELMSLAEERRLLEQTRTGDLHARNRIVLAHSAIVRKLARRYGRSEFPVEDLIQEGYLAIFHAIDRFRPQGTTRLATYATWWIRHYMWRAIAAQRGPLCLPPAALQQIRELREADEGLSRQLRRGATCRELATELGRPVTQIRTLRCVYGERLSAAGDELERISDVSQQTPLEHVTSISLRNALRVGLKKLSRQEAHVIRLRYGLDGSLPMTLENIGRRHAKSRESIRLLERSALRKLREALHWREPEHLISLADRRRSDSLRGDGAL